MFQEIKVSATAPGWVVTQPTEILKEIISLPTLTEILYSEKSTSSAERERKRPRGIQLSEQIMDLLAEVFNPGQFASLPTPPKTSRTFGNVW